MKKYIMILISFFLLIFLTACSKDVSFKAIKEEEVEDGITFKTEYESDDFLFQDGLEIAKENPFKYLTLETIENVFNNTSLVYIGSPSDINSRYTVKILMSLAKDYNIKDIYYFDVLTNMFTYELEDKELIKISKETDLYKKMVEKLNQYLDFYSYVDDDIYKTEDKCFKLPTLVFIKDGEIISFYDKIEELDDESVRDIKIEEIKEDIYDLTKKLDL